MAKHNFSSSVGQSLNGRPAEGNEVKTNISPKQELPDTIETVAVQEDSKGRFDKGLGKNQDGTFRQSNAGRKKMNEKEKKVQVAITISPTAKEALEEWASEKPRSITSYISEYIEEHIEELIKYYNK